MSVGTGKHRVTAHVEGFQVGICREAQWRDSSEGGEAVRLVKLGGRGVEAAGAGKLIDLRHLPTNSWVGIAGIRHLSECLALC
jgi:hypothetical protein